MTNLIYNTIKIKEILMKQLRIFLLTLFLFLPILITGCSNNIFDFKNSELIEDCYTITVENNVEEYSLIDDISVGKKQTWTVAKDEYGVTTFTTKKVPLVIGDNYYYIIVFDKDDTSSIYKINIIRKANLLLKFNYDNINDIIVSDIDNFELPTPEEKTHYQFNGWFYNGILLNQESIIEYLHLNEMSLVAKFSPCINDINIKQYTFRLDDILGVDLRLFPGDSVSDIKINVADTFLSLPMNLTIQCNNYPEISSIASCSVYDSSNFAYSTNYFRCMDSQLKIIINFDGQYLTNAYYDSDWSIVISILEN